MRGSRIAVLALIAAGLMATGASAGFLFNGAGNPVASGLEAINGPTQFTFDVPRAGATMGGGLTYHQGPGIDDGGYGLQGNSAGAELNPSTGYFAVTRFEIVDSRIGSWPAGGPLGFMVYLEDAAQNNVKFQATNSPFDGNAHFSMNWNQAQVPVVLRAGFNEIKFVHPGGGGSKIDLYLNGTKVADDFQMKSGGNGFARFFVGNGGADCPGEAYVDYIGINVIPEPASAVLLTLGGLMLLRRRQV